MPEKEKKSALLYIATLSIEDAWELINILYSKNEEREKIRFSVLSDATICERWKDVCTTYNTFSRNISHEKAERISFIDFDASLKKNIDTYYMSLVDLKIQLISEKKEFPHKHFTTFMEKLLYHAEAILDAKKNILELKQQLQQDISEEEKKRLQDWIQHRQSFVQRMQPNVLSDITRYREKNKEKKLYTNANFERELPFPNGLSYLKKTTATDSCMIFNNNGVYSLRDLRTDHVLELPYDTVDAFSE